MAARSSPPPLGVPISPAAFGWKAVVLGIFITALGAALLLAEATNGPARAVTALLLVLVLPGYTLTGALFPPGKIVGWELIALSFGLSLTVTILGGLVLNWSPWGIGVGSLALFLVGTTLCSGAVSLARGRIHRIPTGAGSRLGLNVRQALSLGLAVLLVTGAMQLARVGATQQRVAGFTLLWLQPAQEVDQHTIRLGVGSRESTRTRYRLEVAAGGHLFLDVPSIELAPGEKWETVETLPSQQAALEPVEAVLYRLDAPEGVYRRVVLWRGQPQ